MIDNVETDWCCGCYELKFTTGPIVGKTMIVQAQNTGYDQPTSNVFNFAVCLCSLSFLIYFAPRLLRSMHAKVLAIVWSWRDCRVFELCKHKHRRVYSY